MTKSTRSPRAPSFSLQDSLENALKLYEANGKHSIPNEVAARTLGYSGANNGSASRALASLKAFGLVSANQKGDISVSSDVEAYKYAPDEDFRKSLLVKWVLAPKVYKELLEEYSDRLPSDQVVRFRLINKMGFSPSTAEDCLKIFQASVSFSDYYTNLARSARSTAEEEELLGTLEADPLPLPIAQAPRQPATQSTVTHTQPEDRSTGRTDRILVRLSKGRRAWLEIPDPLFHADKELLKKQIDLILTDDDDL